LNIFFFIEFGAQYIIMSCAADAAQERFNSFGYTYDELIKIVQYFRNKGYIVPFWFWMPSYGGLSNVTEPTVVLGFGKKSGIILSASEIVVEHNDGDVKTKMTCHHKISIDQIRYILLDESN